MVAKDNVKNRRKSTSAELDSFGTDSDASQYAEKADKVEKLHKTTSNSASPKSKFTRKISRERRLSTKM